MRCAPNVAHRRFVAAGVLVAVLASTVIILDQDLWPAISGLQKWPYIVLGCLILSVLLPETSARQRIAHYLWAIWITLTLFWIAWPQIGSKETLWLLGGLVLGMLLMLPRLHDASRGQRDGLMMLVLAGIGLCGISLGSGSLIIAELSLAITASLAGLWVWSVCGGITLKDP